MSSRIALVGRAFAAMLIVSAAANAQSGTDSRWAAWTGCWQASVVRADPGSGIVCLTPTAGSAIEIAMVDSGKVIARDTVDASGQRRPYASQGCIGWRSGEWSADGRRVYMKSELACAGNLTRTSTGMFAMNGDGDWLQLESASSSGNSAVRAVRYAAAGTWIASDVPAELTSTLNAGMAPRNQARMLASTDIGSKDVIDAAAKVDTSVVQTWLIERGQEFDLDAKQIVSLAKAGVPGSVIDVMVGISYPSHFALAGTTPKTREADSVQATKMRSPYGSAYGRGSCSSMWDPTWYPGYAIDPCGYGYRYGIYSYGSYSPYGYGGYGGGYGGGYYPSQVVVIEKRELPHGTAVNGRGYTQGRRSGGDDDSGSGAQQGSSRGSERASGSSSGSSSKGSSSGSSSSGSSSKGSSGSSSSGRTAQKRGGQ